MRNIFITSAIATLLATAAMAQDTDTTVVTAADTSEEVEVEVADVADHAAVFAAICNSTAVLSDKAQAQCDSGNMPSVIKDGTRWSARGVGAEFNTLARNLSAF